jgi:DNA-binding beta-propeller fold protein YncE
VSIVSVNPKTGRIFVGNPDDNRIWALDPTTYRKTLLRAADCCGQADLEINPASHLLYTLGIDDSLYSLNPRTGKTAAVLIGSPAAVAINPVTNTLYVTDLYSNNLYVVDGRNNHLRATLTFGTSTGTLSVAVNPRTNTVFVVADQTLYAVDGRTNKVIRTGSVAPRAEDPQIDPSTNTLYLLDATSSAAVNLTRVTAINGRTLRVAHRTSFASVDGMWVDPRTHTVYVDHDRAGLDPTLSSVDGRTGRITGSLPLGFLPGWITGDPTRGCIYLVGSSVKPLLVVVKD